MSSRIKQQSSDNRSSLRLCVNTDSFVLHFVPFWLSGSKIAATAIKRFQIAVVTSRAKAVAYRWNLPNIFRDVGNAICSACYVAFMTGSTMGKHHNRGCHPIFLGVRTHLQPHTNTHRHTHTASCYWNKWNLFYKNCTFTELVMRLPWRGRKRRKDGKRRKLKKKRADLCWSAGQKVRNNVKLLLCLLCLFYFAKLPSVLFLA